MLIDENKLEKIYRFTTVFNSVVKTVLAFFVLLATAALNYLVLSIMEHAAFSTFETIITCVGLWLSILLGLFVAWWFWKL